MRAWLIIGRHDAHFLLVSHCRTLDRDNLGVIKRYQFKELLEARFNIKVSDEELNSVVRPLLEDSAHGLIPYAQFLELFSCSRYSTCAFSSFSVMNPENSVVGD